MAIGRVMAGYDLSGADSRIRKTLGKVFDPVAQKYVTITEQNRWKLSVDIWLRKVYNANIIQ